MKAENLKNPCLLFLIGSILLFFCLPATDVYAFSKLKNGFETITQSYLIPLTRAVAGCAFLLFVILSFFRQEEYTKKLAMVAGLSIFGSVGLEIIDVIIQTFS